LAPGVLGFSVFDHNYYLCRSTPDLFLPNPLLLSILIEPWPHGMGISDQQLRCRLLLQHQADELTFSVLHPRYPFEAKPGVAFKG
jgi:hypothetical protein